MYTVSGTLRRQNNLILFLITRSITGSFQLNISHKRSFLLFYVQSPKKKKTVYSILFNLVAYLNDSNGVFMCIYLINGYLL